MPRGGRRAGSGPPRVLDDLERLEIYARCEDLWREAWQASEAKAMNLTPKTERKREARGEYEAAMRDLDRIPILERRAWLDTFEAGNHRDVVEEYRRSDQGIDDADDTPAALIKTVKVPQPYGVRGPIMDRVAAEFSHRLGKTISTRQVRTCWEEVRSALNRV